MKQFLILCFAFSLLAGCKKKSSDPPPFQGYVRMTIDGTRNITADKKIWASTPRDPTSIRFYGTWSNGSVYVSLNNAKLGETPVTSSSVTRLDFELYDPSPTGYFAGYQGSWSGSGVIGSGKINILEMNNEYVKGTFEFTTGIYNTNPKIRTVTNGEFHIKRVP